MVDRVLTRLDLHPVVAVLMLVLLVVRWFIARRQRRHPPAAQAPGVRRDTWVDVLDAGLLAIFVVYVLVRPFVAQVAVVTSTSMAPTLHGTHYPELDGPPDRLLISRLAYAARAPRRGEIVVLRLQRANTSLSQGLAVKRVVAVAGDTVAINEQGRLVVNGVPLDEPYLSEPSDRLVDPVQVPQDTVYVLGDNRRDSRDSSRFEGSPFVARTDLLGRAVAVVWPLGRVKLLELPEPWRRHATLDRDGE